MSKLRGEADVEMVAALLVITSGIYADETALLARSKMELEITKIRGSGEIRTLEVQSFQPSQN